MGRQILVILGFLGSIYGVILYFTGRHILHTMFGSDMLKMGSTEGTLITVLGVGLALLGTAVVCAKFAILLRIHEM